mgnify:CR=1 FL=1
MEEWRGIKGFEDSYEVSNKGNVRSLTKKVNAPQNGGYRIVKGRNLKLTKSKKGYLVANIGRGNTCLVHILVAEAFIPNPEGKPTVNHKGKNGCKTDNRVESLEWATYKENHEHAIATGLHKDLKGEANYSNKLSEEQVKDIIETIQTTNISYRQLAIKYEVVHSTIQNINRGFIWGWFQPEIERPIRPIRYRRKSDTIITY